jgi:hypothetical protein
MSRLVALQTAQASGCALAWLVAQCEKLVVFRSGAGPSQRLVYIPQGKRAHRFYEPHLNWKQAGPILERERIGVIPSQEDASVWVGSVYEPSCSCQKFNRTGPTFLVTGLRCFVASKLGEVAEVPAELLWTPPA